MATLWRSAALGVLVVTMLLVGSVSPAAAEGSFVAGDTAIVATTEGNLLALREGPGIDYQALASFAAGTRLTILDGPLVGDEGLSWYAVSDGALSGWCAADWLVADSGTAPAPAAGIAEGTVLIVTAESGANLRDQPTLAGEFILLIPQGATVTVLSAPVSADGYDWLLVRYGGTNGWVASALLGDAVATTGAGAAARSAMGSLPARALSAMAR